MAGGFVIGGSIFLVLSVFDTFTGLRSVEMREEIDKVLSSSTGEGLGLSVSDALSVMRVGLMVAGACAAAAAVLGVYVFQRSRAARLALSILAVPILLTAPLTGGLMGALVAAATLMLWSGPARDWFAGRPIREVERPAPRKQQQPGPWEQKMPPPDERNRAQDPVPPPVDHVTLVEDSPTGDSATGDSPKRGEVPAASSLSTWGSSIAPAATSGFGERSFAVAVADPPAAAWPPPSYPEVSRGAVPVTVKIACLLTWTFSGLVALLYAVMFVVLIVAQDRIVDAVVKSPDWQRSGLQEDALVPVLWIGCAMFLGWALGACGLAWFAWRRHNWARWLLAASAFASLMAGFFAFPFAVLHQLAAVLTIVGLFSHVARSWFDNLPWTPGPPPGSHEPGSPPPPGSHEWPPPEGYPSGPPQPGSDPGGSPPGGKPPVW